MMRSIKKNEPPVTVANPAIWPSAVRPAMLNRPKPTDAFKVG